MGYEGCLLLCSCAKASIAADSQHARGCVGLVLHSVNGVLIHSKKQVGALVDEEERIEVRFYRPDDNVVMLTHPIGQAAASCWGLVLDHETMALKRCADVSVCSRSKQARASIGKVLSNVNGAPVRTPADVRAAMEGCRHIQLHFLPTHPITHANVEVVVMRTVPFLSLIHL